MVVHPATAKNRAEHDGQTHYHTFVAGGMTLEPEGIPDAEGTSPELKDMNRRFAIGGVLATTMFVLEMGGHLPILNLDHYVFSASTMIRLPYLACRHTTASVALPFMFT